MMQWISVLLAFFIAVDLVVYIILYRKVSALSRSIYQADFDFRSPYIGLDDLYNRTDLMGSPTFAPIVSLPRIAAQVSSIERIKVFPEDEHRYLHKVGTLTPPDRHLLVTNSVFIPSKLEKIKAVLIPGKVHTIVQFRALDYGMERCALALRLPSSEPNHNSSSIATSSGTFTICKLDVPANRMLNMRTLYWDNRPACEKNLGTFSVIAGEEITLYEFSCAWGIVPAFELSCAPETPDCILDVWGGSNGEWGTSAMVEVTSDADCDWARL